jgi:hypothetical protein
MTPIEALEGMVYQFAYWSDTAGGFCTGGLSALEDAFEVLGWEDPHPVPEVRCDEPGCLQRGAWAMNSASSTLMCYKHWREHHDA